MTSDVIDTVQDPSQGGPMTNIGEVVQVVQVEPLTVASAPAAEQSVEVEPAPTPAPMHAPTHVAAVVLVAGR
jgi:hypothetical protein